MQCLPVSPLHHHIIHPFIHFSLHFWSDFVAIFTVWSYEETDGFGSDISLLKHDYTEGFWNLAEQSVGKETLLLLSIVRWFTFGLPWTDCLWLVDWAESFHDWAESFHVVLHRPKNASLRRSDSKKCGRSGHQNWIFYSRVRVLLYNHDVIIINGHCSQTVISRIAFIDMDRLIRDATENQIAMGPTRTVSDVNYLNGKRFHVSSVQEWRQVAAKSVSSRVARGDSLIMEERLCFFVRVLIIPLVLTLLLSSGSRSDSWWV